MANQNVTTKLHMYFCEEFMYRTCPTIKKSGTLLQVKPVNLQCILMASREQILITKEHTYSNVYKFNSLI